mgnify:CR=1 FL=1
MNIVLFFVFIVCCILIAVATYAKEGNLMKEGAFVGAMLLAGVLLVVALVSNTQWIILQDYQKHVDRKVITVTNEDGDILQSDTTFYLK